MVTDITIKRFCNFENFTKQFEEGVIRNLRKKSFLKELKEIYSKINQMDKIVLEGKFEIV